MQKSEEVSGKTQVTCDIVACEVKSRNLKALA